MDGVPATTDMRFRNDAVAFAQNPLLGDLVRREVGLGPAARGASMS
jgi:hypothetical protein